MTEVSGEVYIKNPENLIFSNDIDDIPFNGDLYYFNGQDLIEFSEANIEPTDFVFDDHFKIINIPIIEDNDTLEKMIEVLDDFDLAMERYIEKENPDYVSIITTEELLATINRGAISNNEYILDDLSYDELCEFGQDYSAQTVVVLDKYKVFHMPGFSHFLLLDDLSKKNIITYSSSKLEIGIYVRDVFVKRTSLFLNYILRSLKPENFKVNITHSDIIPSISRNDFNESLEKDIIMAIYQSICLGIHDSLKDHSKKVLIMEYLRKYFGEGSMLLKEKYTNMIT